MYTPPGGQTEAPWSRLHGAALTKGIATLAYNLCLQPLLATLGVKSEVRGPGLTTKRTSAGCDFDGYIHHDDHGAISQRLLIARWLLCILTDSSVVIVVYIYYHPPRNFQREMSNDNPEPLMSFIFFPGESQAQFLVGLSF